MDIGSAAEPTRQTSGAIDVTGDARSAGNATDTLVIRASLSDDPDTVVASGNPFFVCAHPKTVVLSGFQTINTATHVGMLAGAYLDEDNGGQPALELDECDIAEVLDQNPVLHQSPCYTGVFNNNIHVTWFQPADVAAFNDQHRYPKSNIQPSPANPTGHLTVKPAHYPQVPTARDLFC